MESQTNDSLDAMTSFSVEPYRPSEEEKTHWRRKDALEIAVRLVTPAGRSAGELVEAAKEIEAYLKGE